MSIKKRKLSTKIKKANAAVIPYRIAHIAMLNAIPLILPTRWLNKPASHITYITQVAFRQLVVRVALDPSHRKKLLPPLTPEAMPQLHQRARRERSHGRLPDGASSTTLWLDHLLFSRQPEPHL